MRMDPLVYFSLRQGFVFRSIFKAPFSTFKVRVICRASYGTDYNEGLIMKQMICIYWNDPSYATTRTISENTHAAMPWYNTIR